MAAVIGIIGGLIVILSATINVVRWAEEQLDWRDQEYKTLTSLKAGFDVRYFEDQLGRPIFTRHSKDGFVEYTFRGHDYWAQAIAHQGAVVVYAVTSCSEDFQPAFVIPGAPSQTITLRQTKLGDIQDRGSAYEYILGANIYHFFDGTYGALPGHYKSYAWGASTTCGEASFVQGFHPLMLDRSDFQGDIADMPAPLRKFRAGELVNTFVETAPFASLWEPREGSFHMNLGEFHEFTLGPSPLLWRSVSPEAFPDQP